MQMAIFHGGEVEGRPLSLQHLEIDRETRCVRASSGLAESFWCRTVVRRGEP